MWTKNFAPNVHVLEEGLELAKSPITKVITFVMTKITMLVATLMEETVVDPMWTKRSAQCVPVLEGLEFQMVALRMITKGMEYVMMEIIMLGVTLMEETAVYQM